MVIRKVSIGTDYKSSMNYVVNQKVLNDLYIIHLISYDNNSVKVWIENDNNEIILWKYFNSQIPISIEYNINF
tara:strand:- start:111 stop:329 length:219 start_codon:yes stop_codon:yes gene_type:complete